MSRSGYGADYDGDGEYPAAFWHQAVKRAITGTRGQKFLRELLRDMDAMPVKELIQDELVTAEGSCCTMGVVAKARGLDVEKINYECPWAVGKALGIAQSMAAEIAFENDDECNRFKNETPAERWARMRKWVVTNLIPEEELN